MTQSTVSSWGTGKSEPPALTVFKVETLLELPAGSLARLLGYLPVDVEGLGTSMTFEQFLMSNLDIEPNVKRVLLATYRALVLG